MRNILDVFEIFPFFKRTKEKKGQGRFEAEEFQRDASLCSFLVDVSDLVFSVWGVALNGEIVL